MNINYQDVKPEKNTMSKDLIERMFEAIEQFKEWNKIEAEKLNIMAQKRV